MGGIDRQQPTGDGSVKGRQWLARERQRSHGNDDGQQRERVVDDRARGWMKDWTSEDRVMGAVAVAAVVMADVVSAVVATETAMSRQQWR